MIPLLFLFGLFLAAGFYFLAAGLLRLPSTGAARAIAEHGGRNRKVGVILEDGSSWPDISPWMSTGSGGWGTS